MFRKLFWTALLAAGLFGAACAKDKKDVNTPANPPPAAVVPAAGATAFG